jgi:hypothetical protein
MPGLHPIERLGRGAHVGCGTCDEPRGVVQHQHGVSGHDDLVARHGDHAGDRGGDAVDPHGDHGIVVLKRVVDGDAVEHGTARAVDPNRQLGDRTERLELVEECLGRNAEGTDLVVDHDLGALRLGAKIEPALQAAFSSL